MRRWIANVSLLLFMDAISFCSAEVVVISPSELAQEFESMPLFEYFGKTSNCTERARLSFHDDEDRLCALQDEAMQKKYFHSTNGTIIVLGSDMTRNTKNQQGCNLRDIYLGVASLGVIGILSPSINGLLGQRLFLHDGFGVEYEPETTFRALPVLEIYQDTWVRLRALGQNGTEITVQLSCNEENPWENALGLWLVIAGCVSGLLYWMLAVFGIFRMLLVIQRRRKFKAQSIGGEVIISSEIALSVVRGASCMFGFSIEVAHSFVGDDVIGLPMKRFFQTQLIGWSFWNTVLLALLWSELVRSLKTSHKPDHIVQKNPVKVFFSLLICIGPELYTSIQSARYVRVSWAQPIYTLLNFLVTVILQRGAKKLLGLVHSVASSDRGSTKSTVQFGIHVAKHLQLFVWASYLQFAFLMIIVPLHVLRDHPPLVVLFGVVIHLMNQLMTFAKIRALAK